MDVNTGRLRALDEEDQKFLEGNTENLSEKEIFEKGLELNGLEPVPEELQGAARKKLKGKKEAMVSLTSGGRLSRWAAKKRKKYKNYLKNQKLRKTDSSVRKIREGTVTSHWM